MEKIIIMRYIKKWLTESEIKRLLELPYPDKKTNQMVL